MFELATHVPPRAFRSTSRSGLVGATGVEPVTSSLSWKRSYQLSYAPSYRGDYTGALPFVESVGGTRGLRRQANAEITPLAASRQPIPKMTQVTPNSRRGRPPRGSG